MFSFKHLNDEDTEVQPIFSLLPEDEYEFTVVNALNQVSSSGNPMVKLTLKVGKEGRLLTDYLVATQKMLFKIRHFCETTGLDDQFKEKEIFVDACIGRKGVAIIGTEKGKPKPDGNGVFSDKNIVKDYVKPNVDEFKDDKIPF